MQYSNAVNAARLDAVESTIGINAKLKIYTGSQPSDINTAATGTLIFDAALAQDQTGNWMANAVSARPATKGKNGAWSGTGLPAAGAGLAAGYFRITTSGDVAGIQGTCGQGSGELSFDNSTIANGQTVTVNSFNLQSNQ
jgi:hypothetical protein